MINLNTNVPHVFNPVLAKRNTCCQRFQKLLCIGHIIRAIIWLFKKIFPCCFPSVRTSSVPHVTYGTLPKIVKDVKPIIPFDLDRILKLPQELRISILESLSEKDLRAIRTALACKKDPVSRSLYNQLPQAMIKSGLNDFFADHPTWKPFVDSWKGISIGKKFKFLITTFPLGFSKGWELSQVPAFLHQFFGSGKTNKNFDEFSKECRIIHGIPPKTSYLFEVSDWTQISKGSYVEVFLGNSWQKCSIDLDVLFNTPDDFFLNDEGLPRETYKHWKLVQNKFINIASSS